MTRNRGCFLQRNGPRLMLAYRGGRWISIAGDRLTRQQTVATPLQGRLDQSRRLGGYEIGLGWRRTGFQRRCRRPAGRLTAVFGQGLTRQGKDGSRRDRNRWPSYFRFSNWLDRRWRWFCASGRSRFLRCLLAGLRWANASAATPTTTPTPSSLFKFTVWRRNGRSVRGSGTSLRLLFSGSPWRARLGAARRQVFEVGRVFLLLHEIGDVEKSVP